MYALFLDLQQEKTQQTLFAGIEGFDSKKLKHTETQEKNPLPDKDGKNNIYLIYERHFLSNLAVFCYN